MPPEGALSNQGGELFLKENNDIAISLREGPAFVKSIPAMEVLLGSMGALWAPRYPYRSGQPRYILSANVENALLEVMTVDEALATAQKEADDWLKEQNK